MEPIVNLKAFIAQLESSDTSEHAKIISRINIPKEEFLPYAYWEGDGYTRNCIERTKDYELILLCWNPGEKTPIHGHDGQDCWVYQVDGKVTEVRYELKDSGEMVQLKEQELVAGEITYMNDKMGYHVIKNDSKERAMTMHIYALPIDECEVFNKTKKEFECKEMEYDTVKGEEVNS